MSGTSLTVNIGCSWATTHTSLLLPQFLHSELQLPLHHNSALSSLPYIGCCLTGLLAGWIFSQLTRCLSRTAARKVSRQTGGRLPGYCTVVCRSPPRSACGGSPRCPCRCPGWPAAPHSSPSPPPQLTVSWVSTWLAPGVTRWISRRTT